MMWWCSYVQPEKVITVEDMYKEAAKNNTPLLSNYGAGNTDDFWAGYRAHYDYFDNIFRRRYRSFAYYMQEYGDVVDTLQPDFTQACYGILLKNRKKYLELYRVQTISDDLYSLLDNYDMTETLEKDTSSDNTHTSGRHIDTLVDTVEPYQDIDTTTEVRGQKTTTDDREITNGQKTTTDEREITNGQKTTTDTNEVSAYNASGYAPESELTKVEGQQVNNDDNTHIEGQQINTDENTRVEGSQTITTTEEIDQDQHVTRHDNEYGAHTSSDDGSGHEEYILHRKGNIGVTTATDMMQKAWDAWKNVFNFYDVIFADIAGELLRL